MSASDRNFHSQEPITHFVLQQCLKLSALSLPFPYRRKKNSWQDYPASSLSLMYVCYIQDVCKCVWTEAKVWNEAYMYIKKCFLEIPPIFMF